jgi:hypothetical protein
MTVRLRTAALIVLGAAILMIPALLNGFPFIFQDSADYLVFRPHYYRSPFYGIWIFFFHMNRFIWGPAIAQALVGSHLLYTLVKLQRVPWTEMSFLLLVLLLTALSSLPFFVGIIMPDIFAAYMVILLYLIGFRFFEFGTVMRLYLVLLACVAVASHLSHLWIAIGLVALFVPLARRTGLSWRNIRRHAMILLLPVVSTLCAYLTYNTAIFHKVSLSPAGQTFVLANLIEYGPATDYLRAACPDAGYKICSEVGRLPATAETFLWNEGYLDRLGGFEGMASESGAIVSATVANRFWQVVDTTARNILDSLVARKPAKELRPSYLKPTAPIFEVLVLKFGSPVLAAFRRSAQMQDTIPHTAIERIDAIMTPLSLAMLLGLTVVAWRRGRADLAAFSVFMLGGVFGDALFCAAVSGVYDRYQARVTWLVPMSVFIVGSVLVAARERRSGLVSAPV